jgi:hypothetical protein
MSYSPSRHGSRRTPPGGWWSRTACKLHLTLVIALPGCLAAGWFELTRALHGREIAWVYAFEWPLYGFLGIYIWWRLLHSEPEREATVGDDLTRTLANHVVEDDATSLDDLVRAVDPELAAWQAYLTRLQRIDPPGAPPTRDRRHPRPAQ